VLARKRASELEHQIGDLVRDRFEFANPRGRFHVDHWPHVQAADRGMRIHTRRCLMLLDDLHEALDIVAQFLRRHRRVFHE
jgi:hypothetical protein